MNILRQCPLCGHENFSPFLTCKDHTVTGEEFQIVACKHCSLHFTNPRPEDQKLSSYYDSPHYISHTDRSNSLINLLYKTARRFTLKNKVHLINRFSKGTLMDYGCGTGDFLAFAHSKGWDVQGIEPADPAREIANQKIPGLVHSDLIPTGNMHFNVITLWHVLEHVPTLNTTLKSLCSKLAHQGYLILALPNFQSFDAAHYGSYWAAYDVPRHLYHFSKESMAQLLRQHNLSIKRIIPMKLDAFYVSLLSEKYLMEDKGVSGFTIYLKAFLKGLKSNYYAKKNQDQYSSLIYVTQHN